MSSPTKKIVTTFPEVDGNAFCEATEAHEYLKAIRLFGKYVTEVISWLRALIQSWEDSQIRKVLATVLLEEALKDHRSIECELQAIYHNLVVNEQEHEASINELIKHFEDVAKEVDDRLRELDTTFGDANLMSVVIEYSRRLVTYHSLTSDLLKFHFWYFEEQLYLGQRFTECLKACIFGV